MMGSMLAGTDEAPGETVLARRPALQELPGHGLAWRDGSGQQRPLFPVQGSRKFVPEGIEGIVAYRGTASEVIYQFVGGLRSSMGYCGAPDLQALRDHAQFVRITWASLD